LSRLNIAGHHCAGTHDGPRTDAVTGQEHGTGADKGPLLYDSVPAQHRARTNKAKVADFHAMCKHGASMHDGANADYGVNRQMRARKNNRAFTDSCVTRAMDAWVNQPGQQRSCR